MGDRDELDSRLRKLQQDIARLSTKLQVEEEEKTHSFHNTTAGSFDELLQNTSAMSFNSRKSDPERRRKAGASMSKSRRSNPEVIAGSNISKLLKTQRALRDMTNERNAVQDELKRCKKENQQLRHRAREAEKLHEMYRELQELYLALQDSFRSSEIIRKKQKKMIASLQQDTDGLSSVYAADQGKNVTSSIGSDYASTTTRSFDHRRGRKPMEKAKRPIQPRHKQKESRRQAFERLTSLTAASRSRIESQMAHSHVSHAMKVPRPFR